MAVVLSLAAGILPLWGDGCGNSQAENLTKVREFFRALSADFEERPLLASFGGFSSSIHAEFPGSAAGGEGGGGDTFVLAIPLDADFAVETGLALAEGLEKGGGAYPVRTLIAFLGDETRALPGDIPSYGHMGLRDLLSRCEMPETWVLCYLDADEAPSEILIRHGGGAYLAPLQILKPLHRLFSSRGIKGSLEIRYNEIYKLELAEENEVLSLAWEGEINGFCLSGAGGAGGAPVKAGDLADMFLEYPGAIAFPLQSPDRHYSIISFFRAAPLFISEKAMVVFFAASSAVLVFAFLVFSIVRRTRIIRNLTFFLRYSWIILVFLPLLVAIIKGTGLVYSLLLSLFKAAPPPGDYFGLGCTVLLALLLFSLTSPLVKLFPIPGKAAFFGLSAVILVISGAFIAMAMDFTFLPVFLWASFFTFLGAFFNHPAPVFFFALLIPLQVLAAFFNIRETASEKLAGLFLRGPDSWITAFKVAVPALPFALLLEKGIELLVSPAGTPRAAGGRASRWGVKNSLVLRGICLGLVLSFMAVRILVIPSPPPPPERRAFTDREGGILAVSAVHRTFEESRIIVVTVAAKGAPVRFDLSMEGKNLNPVYAAPFPFRRSGDGTRVDFILGEHPPNPFTAEIVLPREFEVTFRARALYTQWDPALDKAEKPETKDYVFTVEAARELDISPPLP
jgi:hypothetical protein